MRLGDVFGLGVISGCHHMVAQGLYCINSKVLAFGALVEPISLALTSGGEMTIKLPKWRTQSLISIQDCAQGSGSPKSNMNSSI